MILDILGLVVVLLLLIWFVDPVEPGKPDAKSDGR
jgi:hypothetical protein